MKYIYLIRSLENGYYKIGISKNPNKRIENLQTGNSSKLKIVEMYQSEFAHQIERTLQRKYSYLKKEGEWFDLQLFDELNFNNDCQIIEKNLIFLKQNHNVFI